MQFEQRNKASIVIACTQAGLPILPAFFQSRRGKALKRGMLGVTMANRTCYILPPVLLSCFVVQLPQKSWVFNSYIVRGGLFISERIAERPAAIPQSPSPHRPLFYLFLLFPLWSHLMDYGLSFPITLEAEESLYVLVFSSSSDGELSVIQPLKWKVSSKNSDL